MRVFRLRLLIEADRICSMHFLLEMMEVVAIMNLYRPLNLLCWLRNLMAAISAYVTPPRKYTRTFLVLILLGSKNSCSSLKLGDIC